MNKKYLIDLAERVAWTAVQAGVAYTIVATQSMSEAWVIPLAAVLAVIKGIAAKKIGDSESAATLP